MAEKNQQDNRSGSGQKGSNNSNQGRNKGFQNNNGLSNNDDQKPRFNSYWIYAFIAIALLSIEFFHFGQNAEEITWQKFERDMLRTHQVDKVVVVNREIAEIYLKPEVVSTKYKDLMNKHFTSIPKAGPHFFFNIGSVEIFEQRMQQAQKDFKENEIVNVSYETRKDIFGDILGWVLPVLLLVVVWMFIFRRMSGAAGGGGAGNIFNVGKSKAKIFDKESNIKINFKDVAGLEEAKVEVKEIVDFLKNPKKFTDLGGKIPKGALLVGPPGTGKTLLAKAVAGEANVPFFSMSGSDFVEMFVGVGASRVRDLFKQAKEKSPCIVFIDEIDAIGRARGRNPNFGANDERENTLNQLLTEMDGFGTNSGVIILAATNRADILDRALLRAGRFDRQIRVELPDLNERKEIFKVHLRPLKIEEKLDIDFLSKQTPGFSGADIANVCNEAALIAARKNKKVVEKQDFLDAVDRIVGGLERKNKIISITEKKTIAFHEAGHATVSWMLEYASPLVKVTIIPRGMALGAAWYLPEERQITTTEQMLDELCATLGGRVSEELNFQKISTGALNDLEKVTKQAYAMVSYFGMSSKIGNMSYYDSTGQSEYSFSKPYSEKTAEVIDQEVSDIIEKQYQRALQILTENKEGLVKLADLLLEKEVIFSEDLERIFGKRNFGNPEESEHLIDQPSSEPEKKDAIEKKDEPEISEKTDDSKGTV
ncbi:MAG: ATP-dependent zinc metalloprotease FtsH [Bacteroidota bacterium]|nr:ATP-dependent zinc metalloprotease FtsH [Bacteroidota bacterium]MDP4225727.1 ATP-dependent zinc metalloprotease FtsH [Bacteroidota bacterium]MDP4272899.1 ATP-dependent zinc metalloprotease FtsH [Bacteroidota bacterium]